MAVLPGGTSNDKIGVEILTVADTAGIAEADASLATLGKTVQATNAAANKGLSLSNLSTSLEKTGKALLPVSLGIAAIGGASIKSAIDFQQQMTYIRTQAGDTTDSISTLSNEVLNLATKSQYGPEQLAQGLYHLASLGLRGAQAMQALDASQRLAAIGGADLESTTSAVGAAMVTGIRGTQDLNQTVGILNSTIGAGNMRMQDLVGALGTGTLSVFKNAGLSLTEFGAALATLTDNGQQADAAATHLRMTISLMAAPSAAAQKQLAAIGMTGNQMAIDMQTKGLVPALQNLKQHLLDTFGTTKTGAAEQEAALTRIFGGGRSSAAIQTLLDQLPRVQTKIQQITSQSGQAANDYAQQMQTANAKLKTAWSDIQVDAIKLGGALLPSVASAAGKIANAVDDVSKRFNSLSPTAKKAIEDIALGFAVGAPLMIGMAKLIKALSAVGSMLGFVGKIARGALGLGGLADGAAEGTAAIAGEGGLLAALTGPVGLGAAIVGLTGFGLYKWFEDAGKGANDATSDVYAFNSATGKTSGSVSMLTLAHNNLAEAQAKVKQLTAQVTSDQKLQVPAAQNLKQAQDNVTQAQNNVNTAQQKFGTNSPQYKTAVDKLTSANADYSNKLHDADANTLNLVIDTGKLQTAGTNLTKAKAEVFGWTDYLNGKLNTGISLAKTLTNTMLGIAPSISSALQGSNKLLQNVQSSAGILQQSSFQLQGGVNLQAHAGGTNYASGGWSVMGENGPELAYLPPGTMVKTNSQSSSVDNSSRTTVNIGTVMLRNEQDMQTFFRQLNQDILNLGKGLTANQGVMA